jgi:hypothetical protein
MDAMGECLTPNSRTTLAALARVTGLSLMAIVVLWLVLPGSAHAATKVWDGGCGGDTSWSCAGNWSGDVVPGPADIASFGKKGTGDSTVDEGFAGEVKGIKIGVGYAGAIVQTRSLTVSSTFVQAAGAFTAADQTLELKAVTLSGGSFTASSGTTSISGALKISNGATFNANGGTVVFDGVGGATLKCGEATFNLVTFANPKGTKTVGSDCDLALGNDPDAGDGGSIKLNGGLSGTGTLTTTGTLTLGGTGSLSGFSGLSAESLTVYGAYDFSSYETFAVTKVFGLVSGASFYAPSAVASFGGKFTISEGAGFEADGGTVVFNGSGNSILACGGKTFYLVRFEQTGGSKTVGPDCSLPLGANPTLREAGGGSVRLNGALSGTETLTSSKTLTLGPTGSLSGFEGLAADTLVVNGAYDFGAYTPFAVENGFVISASGSFIAPAGSGSFGGNFVNKGFFDANEGEVELVGDYQQIVGNTTFYNLTKKAESEGTLVFTAGSMTTIQGTLRLEGANDVAKLTICSSAPGWPWLIAAEGSREIKWVSVADSINKSKVILAVSSKSAGGNIGWKFSELSEEELQKLLELIR